MAPTRRTVLTGLLGSAGVAAAAAGAWWTLRRRPPNIVLILTDDQGYSDVSCTWQPDPEGAFPRIDTPRIDGLAAAGMRLDTFYAGASVCTTSRAALLTGCYPPRVGFGGKDAGVGVLGPTSRVGLHPGETTLAEVLRGAGYATGCVGKWHLGHDASFLPTNQGFDGFFGIPYSHNHKHLPLMRDLDVIDDLTGQPSMVGAFTQAAVAFMTDAAPGPFFLYLAHSAPHWPWNVSGARRVWGPRGPYGDVIAELDWGIGEVLDALERLGVADDTIVVFCSDNGPYVDARTGLGGSSWPFRGGKSDTLEGGVRSPFLARWPGTIPAGARSDALTCAIDLLPTFAGIAGAPLPSRPIDGGDIGPILRGEPGAASPHETLAYYARGRLEAIRGPRYKRVFANGMRSPPVGEALYDLVDDPGETTDVAAAHPDEVAALEAAAEVLRGELGDEIRGIAGAEVRPIGWAPK